MNHRVEGCVSSKAQDKLGYCYYKDGNKVACLGRELLQLAVAEGLGFRVHFSV